MPQARDRIVARRAAADLAHRRRAREAPAGGALGHSAARDAGGAGDRRSPLLRPPRRRLRSACVGAHRHQPVRQPPYLVGGSTITQQLARNFFLPKFEGMTLQTRASARRGARLLEQFMSLVLEPRHQGRDPRAVPERRVARPARLVRDPRRGRGGAALLRQGRQQPVARRGGDDRRRHPVAVGALAVQQPGRAPRAPQRRAAGDGRRRLHHAARPPTRAAEGAADRRRARARGRGAVLRRLRRPDARPTTTRA